MVRSLPMICLFVGAGLTACAGDEKKPVEPLAQVSDDAMTNPAEAAQQDDDLEMGAGLKNLKIQEGPEVIAAVPVAPIAKVAPKAAQVVAATFTTPTNVKNEGKHLWVFVDTLVVRGKPSKAASVVGTVPYGVMVPVLGDKDGFVKIGDNQWVSRRFLTDRQSKFIPAH